MSELTFQGDIVKGSLPIATTKMVCVPSKEHHNTVYLCLKDGFNVAVSEISTDWLNFENKKKLGYEIQNRWNSHPTFKDLITRSLVRLSAIKEQSPDSFSESDNNLISELQAAVAESKPT